MTNEEAIEILTCNYPSECFEQLREAVDMAIKALKKQYGPDINVATTWIPYHGQDIPCGYYLVQCENGKVYSGCLTRYGWMVSHCAPRVVAYRELPERYEEDKHGNDVGQSDA